MATAVNEITGKIIKSGVDNYKDYSANFDLIGSGITCNQPETLFPVTVRIPKDVYKAFTALAIESGTTIEKLLEKQVLSNFNK
jgi:hypothetical protein